MKKAIGVWIICGFFYSHAAQAAEGYFHYAVTLALALTAGWSWEEAITIASANLGVDENAETVASLEMTEGRKLPHASPKSYRFHCFSRTNDRSASRQNDRNRDVKANLAALEEHANRTIDRARASQTPADSTQMLIAIGVYLHCQQDSWFHSGFGGRWDGHALETLLATIFQRPDPDHAAARPAKTEFALYETLDKLIGFRARWQGSSRQTTRTDLSLLKHFLTHPQTKRMSKRARAQCHQSLLGHWLYLLLSREGRLTRVPEQSLQNDLARRLSPRCQNMHRQVFAGITEQTWLKLPLGIVPKLNLNGEAEQIHPDGRYERRY